MSTILRISFIGAVFLLTSCLSQGEKPSIPGVKGPNLNVQDGKIVLSLTMTQLDSQMGVSFPIKKLENSHLYIGPGFNSDGSSAGTLVKANFDLNDVLGDDFNSVPSSTLPDGRDFPFLVDGKLPAFAINIPKAKDITVYASKKVYGFFLPLQLPDDFIADVHFKIVVNDKSYGVASLIHPNAQGEGSGLIVLLTLDEIRKNPGLKKLLRASKKNKHRLY